MSLENFFVINVSSLGHSNSAGTAREALTLRDAEL